MTHVDVHAPVHERLSDPLEDTQCLPGVGDPRLRVVVARRTRQGERVLRNGDGERLSGERALGVDQKGLLEQLGRSSVILCSFSTERRLALFRVAVLARRLHFSSLTVVEPSGSAQAVDVGSVVSERVVSKLDGGLECSGVESERRGRLDQEVEVVGAELRVGWVGCEGVLEMVVGNIVLLSVHSHRCESDLGCRGAEGRQGLSAIDT